MKISPQEVVVAYEKSGWSPVRGMSDTGSYDKSCCGLGVLHVISRSKKSMYAWAYKKYGKDYTNGFIHGFDNMRYSLKKESEEYVLGVKDGRKVARLVFKKCQ